MKNPKHSISTLTLIVALLLGACSNSPQAAIAPTATATATQKLLEPIDIIVAIDRTGSKTANKIPDLTIEQAKTLAQAVQKRGGRFKVLPICRDSDRTLIGLTFPTPATAPTPPAPLPAAGTLNNFELVKNQEAYTKVTATYQAEKAKFDRDVQTTLQQDNQQIDNFIAQIKPLLEAPAQCKGSDIIGGIARADLSLSERSPDGRTPMKKIALFITDGEENINTIKQSPNFTSKPELIVVSGGKGTGVLEPLNPIKFESIDAAIADILSR